MLHAFKFCDSCCWRLLPLTPNCHNYYVKLPHLPPALLFIRNVHASHCSPYVSGLYDCNQGDYLCSGDAFVPVADCGRRQFGAHPKENMLLRDYMVYWERVMEGHTEQLGRCHCQPEKSLYLKDWHFTK